MDIVNNALQDAICGLLDANDSLKQEVATLKNKQNDSRHAQEQLELDRMNLIREVGQLKQELARAKGDTAAQAQRGPADENKRIPIAFEEVARRYLQKKDIEEIQRDKEKVKQKYEAANKLLTNLVKKGVDERDLLESEKNDLMTQVQSLDVRLQSSTERIKSLEKEGSSQNAVTMLRNMTKERIQLQNLSSNSYVGNHMRGYLAHISKVPSFTTKSHIYPKYTLWVTKMIPRPTLRSILFTPTNSQHKAVLSTTTTNAHRIVFILQARLSKQNKYFRNTVENSSFFQNSS